MREIAARLALPNATKKDSTGICFIGERPFREFLNRYLPTEPGPIVDDHGRRIGEHVGLAFYTLGQRKGIGIGGARGGSGEPWFVAAKRRESNTLVVVQGHDHPLLCSRWLRATDAHWIAGGAPDLAVAYGAKTRYRQADSPCAIAGPDAATTAGASGIGGGAEGVATEVPAPAGKAAFCLRFEAPQWAVTPGQSAVLYDGEVCLGGGVIDSFR